MTPSLPAGGPSPPAGLYIHIPFCVRRCLYCDFYVETLGSGSPASRLRSFRDLKHHRFLQALECELASLPDGFQPATVYVGGGTPTELPPGDLDRLFSMLATHIDLSQVTEFSCEANPGTLDREMADVLAAHPVDRVSLGVQSFDDRQLEALGRIHRADEVDRAVSDLRAVGIDTLSLDLLFALPGARPEEMDLNLDGVRRLQPDHVSWYSLEFEPGTVYTELRDRGALEAPEEEAAEAEYHLLRDGLARLGYSQYELFSFARPGAACRHNLNYWKGGEYVGCGPSAHSHVQGTRWSNRRDLTAYLAYHLRAEGHCREPSEALPPEARARERLMTTLRLTRGIRQKAFTAETGFTPEELMGESFNVWINQGWLLRENDRLRLAPGAYFISDTLFREFV